MLDRETDKLMREEEKFFGISPGYKIYSPLPFSGINQQSSRQGMADQEFFFIENFINIGQTNLRTLWDKGAPIYTAPNGKTIVYFFWFNIGPIYYCAIFLSDGTAIQVSTAGIVTTISSVANTFYNTGISKQLPACGQWGALYLLIVNNLTQSNYYVWNGSVFFQPGGLSPTIIITNAGSGYSQSSVIVAAYGGHGSGATFSAIVTNGSVTSINVLNPGTGYVPTDIVQLFITGSSSVAPELVGVLTATGVATIAVSNGGNGYLAASVVITSNNGSGSGATATAVISGGIITGITMTAAGSGYTDSPIVTITSASGTGATAYAFLEPTTLASVTVNYGGSQLGNILLSVEGGGGEEATVSPVISLGAITSVTVTAAGNSYTSAPAIVVTVGLNIAASASASLMPYGISGTSIETFVSRVWIPFPNQSGTQNNGGIFNVTAPGSFTDFATSDGSDTFVSTDSFLRAQYTNIKQSNGYLYPLGDSSVSVISNVQSAGSPVQTTFNYQNTDPQIGTSWRDSVAAYSTTILFGNQFGVYGVYGGKATKISAKIDNIFNNAVFPAAGGVIPSSAIANLFAQKAFLMLLTITDPFTFSPRNILLGWDEKQWFVASQSNLNLTFIGTQEINSNCVAWGTDGNALYPLFNAPSANLEKTISTKLYGQQNFLIQKQAIGCYLQVQDLSPNTTGITFDSFTVDSETGYYSIPNTLSVPSCPPPYYAVVSTGSGDVYGVNLGLTFRTTSLDFSCSFIGLGYIETGSIALGSTPINGQINTE